MAECGYLTDWVFTYTGPVIPRDGLSLRPHFSVKAREKPFTALWAMEFLLKVLTSTIVTWKLHSLYGMHGLWSNKMVFIKAVDRMWLVC